MASTWHMTGKVSNLSNERTTEKKFSHTFVQPSKSSTNQTFYGPSILLAKKS